VTERAIEDWLTKASERGYQTAFCHLLNAMGYTVLHSSTHGPSEEGKDVIARNSRGGFAAFQLKRGPITVARWREMKGEVEERVEYSIKHASVPSGRKHKSYLVTTGYVNEPASSRINAANANWRRRGFPGLEVWAGSQLLALFHQHTGHFLPQAVPEFHRLLGFMIGEGHKLLDKDEFHLLLQSVLPVSASCGHVRKGDASRVASASLVIAEYAMAGYDRAGNHFARLEAYTMIACYIWAASARQNLRKPAWRPTIDLIETAVDRYARLLFEESMSELDFNASDPAAEPIIGPFRATLLGGVLASHGLWVSLGGKSEWFADAKDEVLEVVVKCQAEGNLCSEYFVPHIYLMAEFLRQHGRIKLGEQTFLALLRASVLRKQTHPNRVPLWSPYVPPEEAVLRHLGRETKESLDDVWEKISYTAWALILIAARRGWRQFLAGLWRPITEMEFFEPIPPRAYQRLLWRFENGRMREHMVRRPTSWGELRREASRGGRTPWPYSGLAHWLPYYLMVYPHRFCASFVLGLDDLLSR